MMPLKENMIVDIAWLMNKLRKWGPSNTYERTEVVNNL
jgi:hypothetical protein